MFNASVVCDEDEREGGWIFFVEDCVSKEGGGEEDVDGFEVHKAVCSRLGKGSEFVNR